MKYVLLAIFVLIAAQPVQAAPCDMQNDQSNSQNQHGGMHHDDNTAMDCCDDDPTDSSDGCSSMSQCGSFPVSLAAAKPSLLNTIFYSGSKQYLANSNALVFRSGAPPLRPPIS